MLMCLYISDGRSGKGLKNKPSSANANRSIHVVEMRTARGRRSKSQSLGDRGLHCQHCPSVFENYFTLAAHNAEAHMIEMPFNCCVCGKGYHTSSGLNLHMESHSGKSYMCPICDSKFTQKGTIKLHLKAIHHMAQCPTCLAVFRLGQEYNQHVLYCRS